MRCSQCGRLVEVDPRDVAREAAGFQLYGSRPSVTCGPRCEALVDYTRTMLSNGWALTPRMLRQEARA